MENIPKNPTDKQKRDTQDGTKGFNPKLGGQGKVGETGTSSFDANIDSGNINAGPPDYTIPGYPNDKETAPTSTEEIGQEEGGRMRQPTTSIVGRLLPVKLPT